MTEDYGKYHDDIWDLAEFIQGTADVRIKYLSDNELAKHLESAIESLDKAKSLLIKKSSNEIHSEMSE